MTTPTITEVRSILLDTLKDLRDPNKPMDLDRAKTVVQVAQTLIDSGKVEVEAMKALGAISGSGFIEVDTGMPPPKPVGGPVRQ